MPLKISKSSKRQGDKRLSERDPVTTISRARKEESAFEKQHGKEEVKGTDQPDEKTSKGSGARLCCARSRRK